MSMNWALVGIGLLISAVTACGDEDPVAVTTGSVEVTVVTTGDLQDEDGYALLLDGVSSGTVATNGSVELSGVEAGDHSLELTDMADGCSVDGDNPTTVSVTAESSVSVGFNVVCGTA